MTQTRRDDQLKQALGQRLKQLVDVHLKMDLETLAKELGYASSTTLRRAREGETMLSAEKLARLAELRVGEGQWSVSMDWYLTGRGAALVSDEEATRRASRLAQRIDAAGKEVHDRISVYLDVHEGLPVTRE